MANFDWKAKKSSCPKFRSLRKKSVPISGALNVGILGASSVGQIGVTRLRTYRGKRRKLREEKCCCIWRDEFGIYESLTNDVYE